MKKVIFFAILLVCLFIINNFLHSIYNLWQKQDLITSERQELARQKAEQRDLKQSLRQVSDPSYIEEEARDKLFLSKPGEQVVVLPQVTPMPVAPKGPTVDTRPAWQQWYSLFF